MSFRPDKLHVSGLISKLKVSNLPGLLTWWYRLTTPIEPPASTSFSQREMAMR